MISGGTLRQQVVVAEDAAVRLHRLADPLRDLGHRSPDVAPSRRASRARDRSPASRGSDLWAEAFRFCSMMWLPAARPNTSRSSSELVPSRLAPCTDTHAHSPTA